MKSQNVKRIIRIIIVVVLILFEKFIPVSTIIHGILYLMAGIWFALETYWSSFKEKDIVSTICFALCSLLCVIYAIIIVS